MPDHSLCTRDLTPSSRPSHLKSLCPNCRQQRAAAANLLRQWKEKRALEDLKSPAPKDAPSFSINGGFPLKLGPLGSSSSSTQAGLEHLAGSLGSLFEELQVTRNGDLVIEVQGECDSHEEGTERSGFRDRERKSNAVFYANTCIVCQRVPYVAAALRFATWKQSRQSTPSYMHSTPDLPPAAKLYLSSNECSALGVRAVLEWAYTGSFAVRDWDGVLDALQAGAYLGAIEVVQLSQGWLFSMALSVGKELEKLSRSAWAQGLRRPAADAPLLNGEQWGFTAGTLFGNLLSADKTRRSRESNSASEREGRGFHEAERSSCSCMNQDQDLGLKGVLGEALDFVVGSVTVLLGSGEDVSAQRLVQTACPSVESVLLVLLHIDLRVASSVLETFFHRLDQLRSEGREQSAGSGDGSKGTGDIDAWVFEALYRWWGFDPASRFAPARALLEEHVCLGVLQVGALEEMIALVGGSESGTPGRALRAGLGAAKQGLVGINEVEAAYRFALQVDNKHGRSQRLMRQSLGRWKWREQSRAWRSWHLYCREGLGTSRVVLARKTMRIWCLRSAAHFFTAWRQAALEGKIEERQRLALWKWQKACQKLLRAKQRRACD
jgi:hypothetical protein